MATFTVTISNGLRVHGPTPTNKWGSFLWGENWGESKNGYFTITKVYGNSVAIASEVDKQTTKALSNGIAISSDANLGALQDGSGYDYIFPNNTTDPDNRYFPTWTAHTDPATTFTSGTGPTTTWSAA